MMEQRRALTFTFTKDNRMENPLIIPKTCLSPELEKLQKRVSWTVFSDCKRSHENLPPKNGVDCSRAAKIKLEMMRREPLLVLTDVLKTKMGRDYMERIKRGQSWSSRRSVTQSQRASAQADLRSTTSNTSTSTRTERNDRIRRCRSEPLQNHSRAASTPTKTPPSDVKRKNVRLRKEESTKIEAENDADGEEVVLSTNNQEEEDFAEVVDCELLVSCEPAEDPKSCKKFTQSRITKKWTESEKDAKHSLCSEVSQQKRKRRNSASLCNGSMSHKRQRESVLRLSGEDRRDAGPQNVSSEHSEENLDPCIVQFTVGGDDHTDVALSLLNSNSEADDAESSQENTTKDSEPIVLSSDEEETRCSDQVGESVIRGVTPRRPKHQQTPEQMEMVQVVEEDVPHSAADPPLPVSDYSTLQVSFSTLYCGGHRGNANGDLLIKDQEIFIPLTDNSGDQNVTISLGDKDLRKYSVWEQSEMELEQLCFEGEEEIYPVTLLLFVSESAAAALQRDLCRLQAKEDGALIEGKASPFILLTLIEPLEGVKGALFRSVLDIKCLDAPGYEDTFDVMDKCNTLEDLLCPALSLDESLALIQRNGRDSHLLSMLGMESTDSDKDTGLSADVQLQEEPQEASHEELQEEAEKTKNIEHSVSETTAKPETKTFHTSEDQTEEEPLPSEKQNEEPGPVYTLAHRRLKNSYSVSLCQPDSHWMKYKHQGLPRRLIQFPPPPLKGGITVTMEDLQCLDNGQFLNDVIIDFYLKYLLQKASAAVAERSHIFSSFFYKQLTRRDNASEGGNSEACQRQRRHQRVKTWTRHVDIFKKDFLFVPVNQEAHWYLVVICFPGLDEPMVEELGGDRETGASLQGEEEETRGCTNRTDVAESPPAPTHSDGADTQSAKEDSTKDSIPGPVDCTELTCQRKTVCKRPCILIMDSLKLSLHERVFKLLREYLQSEWEVRRGSQREFGPDQMKSSHCRVPLQDNSSDCGLYLLQYVECFLKDPVAHFELPLSLEKWFPRQQVRRKREEIRDLILYLYRHQNLENPRIKPLLY
ncbi:uncharacterized protein LOC114455141 isoform X2 [Gouania willdenowi]|uniref:uncharacterized protein LOC114455141 isoform X2 n=1 Tax=Gouania willdenowi TaxID=441366 RepID=UPI001054926A|nr:uncharacterized protein LOC114455141 isoform X2 [Gouania willdenowi]